MPTGFVDLQVNGFLGVDFSSPELTEEAAVRACQALLAQGTSAFLPTIITSPEKVYRRNLPLLARVAQRPEFTGRVLGLHAEGPFLSRAPGAVGAHNPEWVVAPDLSLLDRMVEWSGGALRLLTLAADQPGAAELTRQAVARGLTVALGHHLATPEDLAQLAAAGARALTHLGNGIPNQLDRHRNAIWAGLAEDRLFATLITDGHHLPREVVKVMLRAKGIRRVCVVSDAAPVAGLPPGRYHLLGNDAVLEPSGRLHNPAKQCLVGSSATLMQCLNVLAGWQLLSEEELWEVGCLNPLRLLGIRPEVLAPPPAPVVFDAAQGQFRLAGS